MSIPLLEVFEIFDSTLLTLFDKLFSKDFSKSEETFSTSLTGFSPLSLKVKSSLKFTFFLSSSFTLETLLSVLSFFILSSCFVPEVVFVFSLVDLAFLLLDSSRAFSMSILGVLSVFSKDLSVS